MIARTPDDLQTYLNTHRIKAEIIYVNGETPTVAAAALALNVSVESIVKTVLFLIDGNPYAVLANGTRRVDPRKLAERFGVARKRVKLADADAVLQFIGYAPGTVPPFDHITSVPILMNVSVSDQSIVYAGGGGLHAMLKITSADLIAAIRPEIFDVLEDQPET